MSKITHAAIRFAPEDEGTVIPWTGVSNGVEIIASPDESLRPGFIHADVFPPGCEGISAGHRKLAGLTRARLEAWFKMFA